MRDANRGVWDGLAAICDKNGAYPYEAYIETLPDWSAQVVVRVLPKEGGPGEGGVLTTVLEKDIAEHLAQANLPIVLEVMDAVRRKSVCRPS